MIQIGNVYWFRMAVPLDLRGAFRKREIKISLGNDKKLAEISDLEFAAVYKKKFACIRNSRVLEESQRPRFQKLQKISSVWPELFKPDLIESFISSLRDFVATTGEKLGTIDLQRPEDIPPFPQTALILAEEFQKMVESGVPPTLSLEEKVLAMVIAEARWTGKIDINDAVIAFRDSRPAFNLATKVVSEVFSPDYDIEAGRERMYRRIAGANKKAMPSRVQSTDKHRTLTAAWEQWAVDQDRTIHTSIDRESAVKHFVNLHGEKPIGDYTREHVREFRDALRRTRPHLLGKMMLKEAFDPNANFTDEGMLAPATVSKYLTGISAIFTFAMTELEWIEKNPASNIPIDARKGPPPKVHFNEDELKRIFHSPVYTGCRSSHFRYQAGEVVFKDELYWVPLLAIFTGARLGEICQLRKEDLVESKDGTYYLRISLETDDRNSTKSTKRTKNSNSIRDVSLAQILLDLGVTDLFENALPNTQIFPNLKRNTLGKFGAFGQQVNRMIDRAGADGKRVSFNSFRHTMKHHARQILGYNKQAVDYITGHSPLDVADAYGQGYTPEFQKKLVDLIPWPIEFGHLKKNKA